jgi:hypothetical protein
MDYFQSKKWDRISQMTYLAFYSRKIHGPIKLEQGTKEQNWFLHHSTSAVQSLTILKIFTIEMKLAPKLSSPSLYSTLTSSKTKTYLRATRR